MTIRNLTGLALGIGLLALLGAPGASAAPATPTPKAPAAAPALASIKTPLPAADVDVDADNGWDHFDLDMTGDSGDHPLGVTDIVILSCQPSTARAAWRVPVVDEHARVPAVLTTAVGWPTEVAAYKGKTVVGRTGCFAWSDDTTAAGTQMDLMAGYNQDTGTSAPWAPVGGGQMSIPIPAPAGSKLAILPGEKTSARPYAKPVAAVVTTSADPTTAADEVTSDASTTAAAAAPAATEPTMTVIPLTPAQPSLAAEAPSTYNPVKPVPTGTFIFAALALALAAISSRRLRVDRAAGRASSPLDIAFAVGPVVLGIMAAYDGNESSTWSMLTIMIVLGVVAGATVYSRIGGTAAYVEIKHVPRYINGKALAITAVAAAAGWAFSGNNLHGLVYGALVGLLAGAALVGRRIIIKKYADKQALSGRLAGCFGGSPENWMDGSIAWNLTDGGGISFRPGAQQVSRLGAGFEDRAALIFPEYVVVSATSTLVALDPVDAETAAAREHLAASGGLLVGSAYVPPVDDVDPAAGAPSFIKTAPGAPSTPWTIVEDQETS